MAVGAADKLLNAGLPNNRVSPSLTSAVLPSPMINSTTAAIMDCQLVQRADAKELVVQSSMVHFRASILQAPLSRKDHVSPEGEVALALCNFQELSFWHGGRKRSCLSPSSVILTPVFFRLDEGRNTLFYLSLTFFSGLC